MRDIGGRGGRAPDVSRFGRNNRKKCCKWKI